MRYFYDIGIILSQIISLFSPSPMVQFQLLHSKFHLCSVATRGLLLSTYIKFVNLFPEIKNHIQDVSDFELYRHTLFTFFKIKGVQPFKYFNLILQVLKSQNQLRNADVELQQRAVEYLQLSTVASTDVLVSITVVSILWYLPRKNTIIYRCGDTIDLN